MTDRKTIQLGFRVRPEKARLLEALLLSTDRPKSWLLEKALDSDLGNQAWQIARIELGLADAEAGRTVPHEHVRAWLLTWGRDAKGEPPA